MFHVQGIPINFVSIYHACEKGYLKFESWHDKYVLKDIKHNFEIISSGHVDHNVGLYRFIGFNSSKNQPFIPLFLTLMNKVNYGMKY